MGHPEYYNEAVSKDTNRFQYEYDIVKLNHFYNDDIKAEAKFLDMKSKDGWDLVTVTIRGSICKYYFRRSINNQW